MGDSPRPKKKAKLEQRMAIAAGLSEARALVASLESSLESNNGTTPAQHLSLLNQAERVRSTLEKPSVDPQSGSLLFRLPHELRKEIYEHVFFSTQIGFNKYELEHDMEDDEPVHFTVVYLSQHPLAILSTCRLARADIGDSWVKQVTLVFRASFMMLDKLTSLTPDVFGRIRHVHLASDEIILRTNGTEYPVTAALVFLPGLQLDTLTLNAFNQIDRRALDTLVREGSGWKVLQFVTPYYTDLGPTQEHEHDGKKVEVFTRLPNRWRRVLEARDGKSSKSSVTVYCAKGRFGYDQVLNPSTRTRFEKEVPLEAARLKEVMVVVKRGEGVGYKMRADAPLLRDDIRRDFPGKTYSEIRNDIEDDWW